MFSEDVIGRVRDSADIVDFISGYVSLKKSGKNHQGLCPFHGEKTPSFSVNPDKQIFHCFGCGVGGDIFKFIELQEGLSFPEAVRKLAARAGISLPESARGPGDRRTGDEKKRLLAVLADAAAYYRDELAGPAGSAARSYFEKRGVTEMVVREFELGFSRPEWDGLLKALRRKNYSAAEIERAGLAVRRSEGDGHYDRFRGRIMFPIRDISGSVIAFGGRVMDDSLPKYLNSSETPLYSKSNVLYGLDAAKEHGRKQGYFIIVEGYLDAIACHQYGIRNTVATLGTALTEGHLRLMRRFCDKIILIFDPDPAGVRASLRGFDLFVASGMKVNVVSLPGGDDPDTFLQKQGREAFASRLRESLKFMDFVIEQVVKRDPAATIDEKVEKSGEMLRYISKLRSGIERDYYLKKTAEALDLDEGLLRREMPEVRKEANNYRAPASPAHPAVHKPRAEEILIHLMIRDTAMARELKQRIEPPDFTDPLFRRVAERVFGSIEPEDGPGRSLLHQEDDDELKQLITRYTVLETGYDDPEKTCRDCVEYIKQKDPEKKIRLLIKAIQEAEERGDREEFIRLSEEQRELSRRPGRMIPGKSGANQG